MPSLPFLMIVLVLFLVVLALLATIGRRSVRGWLMIAVSRLVVLVAVLVLVVVAAPHVGQRVAWLSSEVSELALRVVHVADTTPLRAASVASLPPGTVPLSGSGSSVLGGPSLSASYIDQVLASAGSPARGTGQTLYTLSLKYGIDDAVALAFFWHESSYGLAGVARFTRSLGNLRCLGYVPCSQGFRVYPTWEVGEEAWYRLLAGPVYVGAGRSTLEAIIPKYAPASDNNNEAAYIASVKQQVMRYHTEMEVMK